MSQTRGLAGVSVYPLLDAENPRTFGREQWNYLRCLRTNISIVQNLHCNVDQWMIFMSASCVLSILMIFVSFDLTPYDCPVRRRSLLGFDSKYGMTMYRLMCGVLGPLMKAISLGKLWKVWQMGPSWRK